MLCSLCNKNDSSEAEVEIKSLKHMCPYNNTVWPRISMQTGATLMHPEQMSREWQFDFAAVG